MAYAGTRHGTEQPHLARDLSVHHCRLTTRETDGRPAIVLSDVVGVELSAVDAQASADDPARIVLRQSGAVAVRGCPGLADQSVEAVVPSGRI